MDELLDEVEQKFCSSSPPYKPVIKAERMRFVTFQDITSPKVCMGGHFYYVPLTSHFQGVK